MKQDPNFKRIEENMRSGTLAGHQYLGEDTRSLADIILHDQLLLGTLELNNHDFAKRLRHFSDQAAKVGGPTILADKFKVEREEHKGEILCPFADNVRAVKAVTKLTNLELNKTVMWSDLNIHLIENHGFFEGCGAPFRIDPAEYAEVLEIKKA